MLPSWRQCRLFVTINDVSYKKVLPYRGAHQSQNQSHMNHLFLYRFKPYKIKNVLY